MNRHDTFLIRNGKLAGALAMGVLMSAWPARVHANPSAVHRPKIREILRTQGWDSIDNWRQVREQAENLMDWGLYADAVRLYTMARKLLERHRGMQHPLTLRNRADLAHALLRQGKPEGEKLLQGVYAMQLQRLEPDHPDLLLSRHLLTNLLIARGDMTSAEKELRDIVARRARVLGPGHMDTLASRSNLAYVLSTQLRHAEAEQELRLVLAAEMQNLGPTDLQTCTTRARLGECFQQQSKFPEALEEFRAVLAVLAKEYGPRHPLTFRAHHQLAKNLYQQGKHEEAERDFRKLVETLTELTGPDSEETLNFRGGVVDCLSARGKLADAEKELRDIMAICSRVKGEDSEQMQHWREMLVPILLELHRADEAERIIRAVLDLRRKTLGKDHPTTLDAWHTLATCRARKGDFLTAIMDVEGLLQIRERVLGMQHPTTWYTRVELADMLRKAGKPAEALPLFKETMAYYETMYGPMHPYTLKQRNNYSVTLNALGRTEEAIALQETLLKQREQVLGHDHPDTIKSRINVAAHRMEERMLKQAERDYRGIVISAERVVGPCHDLTKMARVGLAQVLCEARRPVEAEAVARTGLKLGLEANLPSGETRVFKTLIMMSLVQQNRGDEKEIVELAAEAESVVTTNSSLTPQEMLAISHLVAWVKMASGREALALAHLDKCLSMLRYWKTPADHHATLRVKATQVVALRMQGKTDQWEKMMAELEPLLKKAFREGEPILQMASYLKRRDPVPLPELKHMIHYSRARPVVERGPEVVGATSDLPPAVSAETRAELKRLLEEGQMLAARGKNEEAMAKFEEILQRSSKIVGSDDIRQVQGHLFVAREAIVLGNMIKAREHSRRAVEIMKSKPPEQGDLLLENLQKVANTLAQTGNVKAAKILVTQVAEVCPGILGESHRATLRCQAYLADVLVTARAPEVGEMLPQLAASLEKHLGPEDVATLTTKLNLLRLQVDKREFSAAHNLAYSLEEPVKRVFGEDSDQNLLVREAAAFALEGQGLRNMAVSELRLVLADAERISGAEALGTTLVRFRFALMLQRANALNEALELHQRNLKILLHPATEKLPVVTETRLQMASVLMVMNRPAEALEYARLAEAGAREFFGTGHQVTKEAERLLEGARLHSGKR